MNINLPEYILTCIKQLNNSGYECYVVGGAIRDSILGRYVNDYDITTNATPEEIIKVFEKEAIFDSGIKHGTITVIIKSHPIEITTYRIDGKYKDSRRPENVYYTQSIMEDCRRRDFTINAICYHPTQGTLDFFNGIEDINKKIIRSIDNPDKRFNEDALRIIRALRFSSQLGFTIEENTKISIFKNMNLLNNISIERITAELLKLLNTNNCSNVVYEYFEIFKIFIPELNNINNTQIKEITNYLSLSKGSSNINLAILLFFIKENIIVTLEGLKLPNITKKKIIYLHKNYDIDLKSKRNIKNMLQKNEEYFNDLIEFKKILDPNLNINEIIKIRNLILKNKEPYKLSHLQINGNDLKDLGFEGKNISIILENILKEIINEKLTNNKSELINYVKNRYIT